MSSLLLCFALLYSETGFRASNGWDAWAAREEIAPRTFIDAKAGIEGEGALTVSGAGNAAAHGGWRRIVGNVTPGSWYRLTVHFRSIGVTHERTQVLARIDWLDKDGKRAGLPEYAHRMEPAGAWKRFVVDAPAPEKAASARIELFLSNAPQATLWWDGVKLESIPDPGKRAVTVASVNLRPRRMQSAAGAVNAFVSLAERDVAKADVILLPEGITVVGTGKRYADVAEPAPGPTTQRLGELARAKKAYVVAGIYEREGHTVYNTAVLIDREGGLAGKYRKVYLPREEVEAGLTPGNDYPVFTTDFGRIGLMICYDVMFPDPARAMALAGAELLLLPIWGGDVTLGRARAIENRVWLASSGYDYPSQIQDPLGETLAIASKDGSVAIATVDLNRRYVRPYLGEWRGRIRREMRFDVAVDRPSQ